MDAGLLGSRIGPEGVSEVGSVGGCEAGALVAGAGCCGWAAGAGVGC